MTSKTQKKFKDFATNSHQFQQEEKSYTFFGKNSLTKGV